MPFARHGATLQDLTISFTDPSWVRRRTHGLHQAAQRTVSTSAAIMTICYPDRTCATPSVLHRLRSRRDRWRHPLSRYSNKVYDGRFELAHAPILGFSGSMGVQYTHGTFSGLDYNDAHKGACAFELYYREPRAVFGRAAFLRRASMGRFRRARIGAKSGFHLLLEYFVNPVLLGTLTPARVEIATKAYSQAHSRNWPGPKARSIFRFDCGHVEAR